MVIMTDKEYVERLKKVAARKTYYKNVYPFNLLYINKDGTSGDCLNTVKALLNGYDVNVSDIGYYQRNLSNTGDVNEVGLINKCTNVSTDFRKLDNKCEILYMKGHIGSYLGEIVSINGKNYNVIECTKAFGGGIVYSWVDSNGTRRNCQGGYANGKWLKHGLLTNFVKYTNTEPTKPDYSKYPVLKKGNTGKYVTELQKLLVAKGYDPKGIDGIFGNGCLAAVKKFQSENTDVNGNKLVVDGCVGQKTWGALYK